MTMRFWTAGMLLAALMIADCAAAPTPVVRSLAPSPYSGAREHNDPVLLPEDRAAGDAAPERESIVLPFITSYRRLAPLTRVDVRLDPAEVAGSSASIAARLGLRHALIRLGGRAAQAEPALNTVRSNFLVHVLAGRITVQRAPCVHAFGVCDADFSTLFFRHGFRAFALYNPVGTNRWYANPKHIPTL